MTNLEKTSYGSPTLHLNALADDWSHRYVVEAIKDHFVDEEVKNNCIHVSFTSRVLKVYLDWRYPLQCEVGGLRQEI
jgi:hypothetical protein